MFSKPSKIDLIGAIPVPVAKKTIFLNFESLRKKVPNGPSNLNKSLILLLQKILTHQTILYFLIKNSN